MSYFDFGVWSSPLTGWFRKSPTLAMELGLATKPTQHGQLEAPDLTPAGSLLFNLTGPLLLGANNGDAESKVWMVLEEGYHPTKSWFESEPPELRLIFPSPIPPSTCKVLQRFFALSGIIKHRTASGFLSTFQEYRRELVLSDPTPITHFSKGDSGEARVRTPRPTFHPYVRWVLA